jgi:hypothetical protein
LTIHKSQGATLDAAEIDVGSGIFECGQTYVALSRVKNLNGLYLTSFDASKIRINRKVKEFYDNLTLNQSENSEIVEAVAIQIAIPVAVPITEIRNENIVRVIKINPTENDILERKLLEIGILH